MAEVHILRNKNTWWMANVFVSSGNATLSERKTHRDYIALWIIWSVERRVGLDNYCGIGLFLNIDHHITSSTPTLKKQHDRK
jgi:hypothetical protein